MASQESIVKEKKMENQIYGPKIYKVKIKFVN